MLITLWWSTAAIAQDAGFLSKNDILDLYINLYRYSAQESISWNGNIQKCDCGSLSEDVLSAAEMRINFFRLANRLQTVEIKPEYSQLAQQAALLTKANNQLTHDPSPGMKCYSEAAAKGCHQSCLSTSDFTNFPETAFVTGMIQDYGEANYYVGHRRWLLYSGLSKIGYGATDVTEAILTANGEQPVPSELPEFVPYPWSGYVPVELIFPKWSFSIPGDHQVDFSNVKITMKDAKGNPMAIKLYEEYKQFLDPTIVWTAKGLFSDYDIQYGQNHLVENGWLDRKIQISVEQVYIDGVKRSFQYFVEPFQLTDF